MLSPWCALLKGVKRDKSRYKISTGDIVHHRMTLATNTESRIWKSLREQVLGFPAGTSGQESICYAGDPVRCGLDPWVKKVPCRRAWQPTPVYLPGESHGQKSLAGYRPWGLKELDMTEVADHARTRS